MTPNLIVIDQFLGVDACAALVKALGDGVEVVRTTKAFTPGDPPVERDYSVIDGDWFREKAPTAWTVYDEVGRIACATLALDLAGPAEERSDLVAKIYEAGHGHIGPHRDLNLVSGVLYLTDCVGGETEFDDMMVKPKVGRLVLFRGNLLHAGALVQSGRKVALIMNFYAKDDVRRPDTYDVMLGTG